MTRDRLLACLADAIQAVDRPHPTRVAIDGIQAAGKTILADELVAPLEARRRPVLRASVDGFHRPQAERYHRGDASPIGYYEDAFDYQTLIDVLLLPLGPGGDRWCRLESFDLHTDTPLHAAPQHVSAHTVLLLDGVFLLRPELNAHWDFRIFVHTDFDVALQRAIDRDRHVIGNPQMVEERYHRRYFPAQRMYHAAAQPYQLADVIIDNNDPDNPRIISSHNR
jgi:uridine kinase